MPRPHHTNFTRQMTLCADAVAQVGVSFAGLRIAEPGVSGAGRGTPHFPDVRFSRAVASFACYPALPERRSPIAILRAGNGRQGTCVTRQAAWHRWTGEIRIGVSVVGGRETPRSDSRYSTRRAPQRESHPLPRDNSGRLRPSPRNKEAPCFRVAFHPAYRIRQSSARHSAQPGSESRRLRGRKLRCRNSPESNRCQLGRCFAPWEFANNFHIWRDGMARIPCPERWRARPLPL